MAEIDDLSTTDASNTARFPENQAASSVNNGARALEGIVARWHKDTNGSLTGGGTADEITLAANQTLTAYYAGMRLTFAAPGNNTGAVTLNVDALGAKAVVRNSSGAALGASVITSGEILEVIYDGTDFRLLGT